MRIIFVHTLMVLAFVIAFTAVITSAKADDDWGGQYYRDPSWANHHVYDHGHDRDYYQGRVVYKAHMPDDNVADAYSIPRGWHHDGERHRQLVVIYPQDRAYHQTMFEAGDFLSPYGHFSEPAHNVVAILPPVKRATHYVQIDNDIYLVSYMTGQILKAYVVR